MACTVAIASSVAVVIWGPAASSAVLLQHAASAASARTG
jgi:hypothetical protein